MDSESLSIEKRKTRRRIKDILSRVPCQQFSKEQATIEKKFQELPDYKKAETIMFYWPLGREVDTRKLIRKAKQDKKKIGLPVVIDQNNMQPYEYTEENNLTKNSLGVREPDPDTAKKIEIEKLDIVVVPGIAFDKDNSRLGRGKGYYDRFLRRLSLKTKTIGLAFTFQRVESLAFNPLSDQKVDLVISS